MNRLGENIYKNARIKAGLKREPAAEELMIAVRTLDKYESFELPVPDDVVERMCRVYEDKYLAYKHLKQGRLGKYLPDIEEKQVQTAFVQALDDANDLQNVYAKLVKVIADGKVSNDEAGAWEQIRKEILDLAGSLIELSMN